MSKFSWIYIVQFISYHESGLPDLSGRAKWQVHDVPDAHVLTREAGSVQRGQKAGMEDFEGISYRLEYSCTNTHARTHN